MWNRTASGACVDRAMKVKSFAMLLPCGIDVFSGVEFVCCPKKVKKVKKGNHTPLNTSRQGSTFFTALFNATKYSNIFFS